MMTAGQGVSATFGGRQILAGNERLLSEHGIPLSDEIMRRAGEYLDSGCTLTYIAVDGIAAGFIALSDTLRSEATNTVARIKETGAMPILMTGDNERAAREMANKSGINELYSNCLPEDKLDRIGEIQSGGKKVLMVGDGINDAPALKKANVGIAMGGIGSDITAEAADIVLINDRISELPNLLLLSKKMMTTIKRNLAFSMTLNFVAIILAMIGTLNPVVGALVHNAGSVAVIINSALLLRFKGGEKR